MYLSLIYFWVPLRLPVPTFSSQKKFLLFLIIFVNNNRFISIYLQTSIVKKRKNIIAVKEKQGKRHT